jgi:hypothetical protein
LGDAVEGFDHVRVEQEFVVLGEAAPTTLGPRMMPMMIWTMTSGAK